MSFRPIILDVQNSLSDLHVRLSKDHNISTITLMVLMFEILAETLRKRAPMEFDEYIEVLCQEMPKGELADPKKMMVFREALMETIMLTMAE